MLILADAKIGGRLSHAGSWWFAIERSSVIFQQPIGPVGRDYFGLYKGYVSKASESCSDFCFSVATPSKGTF